MYASKNIFKIFLMFVIFLVLLLYNYSIASSNNIITPITEAEWTEVFSEITHSPNDIFIFKILEYSSNMLDSSTEKILKSVDTNNYDDVFSAIREGLIGHLLGWYASELSPLKGTSPWFNNRISLLRNRQSYLNIGLSYSILEISFTNMNNAARAISLPSISNID